MLNVIEAGEGPPVALLHGLFGRSQNLASVARRLAQRHRVLSLDLRNHGASPHEAGMDYATLSLDVLRTLEDRGALPCALLGHSMGGKAAMAACLLAPGLITRLLVADIAPVSYAHHNRVVADAMLGMPLSPGMSRAEADAALRGAVPDAAVRGFLLQNFVPGAQPGWRIGLAHIAAAMADIEGFGVAPGATYPGPTLFVRGEHSDYVLPSHRAAIAARFAAARVVTLKGAGHWLHADQPVRFADIAADFLA